MPIPENFRKSSPAVISYSYQDIAEGTGIVVLNLYGTTSISGADYNLTQQQVSADPLVYAIGVHGASVNFDLAPFNKPQTMRGTAMINAGWRSDGGSGGSNLAFTLQKFSDGSATDISQEWTTEYKAAAPATFMTSAINIPIDNGVSGSSVKVQFKKGDVFRLKVKGLRAGAGVPEIQIDPNGSTNKHSEVYIPFDIDL